MDELETKIRALRQVPTRDLWPEIVVREPDTEPTRAASPARRVAIAVFALVLAVAALLLVVQAFGNNKSRHVRPATPPPEGLVVRNVRSVLDPVPGKETFRFDLVWANGVFPGVRHCTLDAVDQHGDVVGTYSDTFITMLPESAMTLEFDVTGSGTDLRASCGPRIDTDTGANYAYAFSDVRAVDRDTGVEVRYRADWVGSAHPGIVTCTLDVADTSGKNVYTSDFNLAAASGHAQGSRFLFDARLTSADGLDPSIDDCHPYAPPVSHPAASIDSTDHGIVAGDGQNMRDCEPNGPHDSVVVAEDVPGGFICVHGANSVDAWIKARTLAGDPPSQQEVADMRDHQRSG